MSAIPFSKSSSFSLLCHPDNASGQDPCLSRKRDRREENRQSLFSLTAIRGSSFLSVQRVLERDAESSLDDELLCFQNQQTLSYPSWLFESPSPCHPELVSGSGFDLVSA
jgi:hypothetical protein